MDAVTLSVAMGNTLTGTRYAQLAPVFNAALLQAGCTTVNRVSMYCAQVGHESLGLRYQREIWGPTAQQRKYGPESGSSLSRQLGNTEPGDGERFMGHGWLMITGRANHLAVSKWAHGKGYVPTPTFFVDHPELLGTDQYAGLATAWYWTVARAKLNAQADAGDVRAATISVNGGTTNLADRQARWDRCRRLGARLLPTAAPAPSPSPPRTSTAALMASEVF